MRRHSVPGVKPRPKRQRGAALLIMLTVVGAGALALVVSALAKANTQIDRDKITAASLAQAKEALIGWSLRASAGGSARPGELPCPDISPPGAAGSGYAATSCTDGAIGRLPWKTLGMEELRDGNGEALWYAIDGAFRSIAAGGPAAINSDTVAAQPVYAADRSTLLTTTAAAVIFAPGAAHGEQKRRTAAEQITPGNYLDNAGSLNNASAKGPYVQGPIKDAGGNSVVNDRLLAIASSDLMSLVEKRVAREARQSLNNFYAAKTYYPFAAALDDAGGECVAGTTRGLLPRAVGSCGTGDYISALPSWFTANNWQSYIYYTVAPACASGTPRCAGGGFLTVGAQTNIRALLIATGKPIAAAPFASKGNAQARALSTHFNDYLDSTTNADGDDTYDAVGAARRGNYNDQMMIVAP